MSSELIPFHALPIYKESTGFILDDEEVVEEQQQRVKP